MTLKEFPKRVLIRTDASLQIGTGHVMRCLALAAKLANHGAQVKFICRIHDGHLIDFIKGSGFEVISLPKSAKYFADECKDTVDHSHWLGCDWQVDVNQCRAQLTDNVDWMIIDHYALDYRWETEMRDKSKYIMCIDDLADRKHDCDVLLDQSLGRCENDYSKLVPNHANMLLGPKYALLRPEFAEWRPTSLARRENPRLRHILITMGGVDADNVTGSVLRALQSIDIPTLAQVTVVLGKNAPWRNAIMAQAKRLSVPTSVRSGVDNMAELMTSCDLAIGAGGSTTWERCALGVPSILAILAENQRNIAELMMNASAAVTVDITGSIDSAIRKAVMEFGSSSDLQSCAMACAAICDGEGITRTYAELSGGYG